MLAKRGQTATVQTDARVRWELKWTDTRRFLKEKSREDREELSEIQKKIEELRLKEQITSLEAEDGTRLEAEDAILSELHRYYSALYKRDPQLQRSEGKRAEVLMGFTNKVSREQNLKLTARPTVEEIGDTVRCLKNDKAQGADGMTAEVIKEIWQKQNMTS
ncbi:hypothetical protein R1sor_002714 [Riccia sorocarpa]|uniref:Uncharacterized protein n=1 Tax=Riccia sorocarpa TaxID=122646 RepID=A0ABD3GZL0_9MARC